MSGFPGGNSGPPQWRQQQQGYGQYAPPPGPPPPPQSGYGYGRPPPSQGGYGYSGGPPPPQGPYGYSGPTPPQGAYGYNGPPPPQGAYGQYNGPAPGMPPLQQFYAGQNHGQNRYQPPAGPPPPNLDAYGHPYPGHDSRQGYPQGGGQQHAIAAPPAHVPQQFGHGAPAGYTFQYSNCTGKRKALLIGINYFGQKGELRGCINDVKNVSNFLMERHNYKREDMVILTDDQSDPRLQPTKRNIIDAMNWLVRGAQPNDALFLHYSGHGGQTEDLDGDEDDGIDEVIYPVDFRTAGHIVDDDIHAMLVKPLPAGSRLTAIFDSCHSGSCMDLPYMYSTKGVLKEPNLAAEAGQGLFKAATAYATGNVAGAVSSLMGLAKSAYKGDSAYKKTKATRTSPADVIMWSGSKDNQTSADATIASEATGAMSWAFITALKQNPKQSYLQLLNSIRDVLQTKYSQKPQLSCSHPLDVDLLFVM